MDQAIRILQAMIEIVASQGFLATSLGITSIVQCLKQALWLTDSTLAMLPHCYNNKNLKYLQKYVSCLPELASLPDKKIKEILGRIPNFSTSKINDVYKVIMNLPIYDLRWKINEKGRNNNIKYNDKKVPLLKSGNEYTLSVTMKRLRPHSDKSLKIYSPFFPKAQHEAWWLILGNEEDNELYVLKRINSPKPDDKLSNNNSNSNGKGKRNMKQNEMEYTTNIKFVVPEDIQGSMKYTIYLINDGYIGLDQQYTFEVEVVE